LRPASRSSRRLEAQGSKIKFIDEGIDHPAWVVLGHGIIKATWKQRRLPTVCTLNEPGHPNPQTL
jgi:hypothetical protein